MSRQTRTLLGPVLARVRKRPRRAEGEASPVLETRPRGLKERLGSIGTIVGCLAGLIALPTGALTLWERYTGPRPNLSVTPGDGLGVAWDARAQRLTFTCGLAFNNSGNDSAAVTTGRARLDVPASEGPPLSATLTSVKDMEKGAPLRFPFSVRPSSPRDLEVTVSREGVGEVGRVFDRTGLYRLVLEMDASRNRPPKASVTYCFWVGAETLPTLETRGFAVYRELDPACGPGAS
jgi:hypothetical protein